MNPADRRLYVYWRVKPAAIGAASAEVARLQGDLRATHTGLRTALFQREGEPPTLMETYAIDGGVTPELQAAIEAQLAPAVAAWADGERHVEVFTPA